MKTRVVVLGAGFGGLELSAILSEAIGDSLDLTLIDKNDSFVFGFSKLDIMFGRATPDSVRLPTPCDSRLRATPDSVRLPTPCDSPIETS